MLQNRFYSTKIDRHIFKMNYILISFLSRLNIFNSFRDLAGGPYYQLGVIPPTHLIYYQIYRPTLALFINPAELSAGRSSTGRNFCCVNEQPYIDQNRQNFLTIFLPVECQVAKQRVAKIVNNVNNFFRQQLINYFTLNIYCIISK